MKRIIGGIQQIGIGVDDAESFFNWYKNVFGSDVKLFDDSADAKLMTQYTGNEVHRRHAIYGLNLQGGGGLEIWQFVSRDPQPADFEIALGDLGIFATRIKCRDVAAFHKELSQKVSTWVGDMHITPNEEEHFFIKDPNGNVFNVVQGGGWFKDEKKLAGGVSGAIIGVSNMERGIDFYSHILDYDEVIYDISGIFEDLSELNGGNKEVRRVLLGHHGSRKGPFNKLLGPTRIELVMQLNQDTRKIYENRYWGDLGFIHICFDVGYMNNIETHIAKHGYEFTVDSGKTFEMGDAGGRFSYMEDPDGTLIELVESHKIPIMKKFGWYYKIKDKYRESHLPYWIVNALRFNRVKKDS